MPVLPERLDFAADPRNVKAAREFVSGVLHGWGLDAVLETAVLLTSEVATNAVRHAGSRFAVVVTRTAHGAQVDVLDHEVELPVMRAYDPEAVNGRGLLMVESLATSWGATPPSELRGYVKGVRFCVDDDHAVAPQGAPTRAGTTGTA